MPGPAQIQSFYKKKDQDDFKSKSLMCYEKNSQENQSINMWLVMPEMDIIYANQQLQECVVTRTVNLQDVIRNMKMLNATRTINLIDV